MDAAEHLLKPAAIGVIPTDTVYGLAARAADRAAADRLYKLKGRADKPGTLIAADLQQLEDLGLKHRYLKAVEQFWPAAVSVVIPVSNPELSYLHQGKMSLAVRIPDDAKLQKLLRQTGPLLTSSANHPGQTAAGTIEQAKLYFGQEADFYEDGGDLSNREPSTVIRIVDDAIEVLRPGAVKIGDDTM
ncbi:MAG TPA: L-threonylcarbamoyladenylate synthase [Candidatus Saccharimonadales bacterium]